MVGNLSTYFMLKRGKTLRKNSLSSGKNYLFSDTKAVLVTNENDINVFRGQPALFLETDENGRPLAKAKKILVSPRTKAVYTGAKRLEEPSSVISWKGKK